MSKCIICKKEDDGVVCKHCLTKNAGIVGDVIKKGGNIALVAIPSIVLFVATKGKSKPRI